MVTHFEQSALSPAPRSAGHTPSASRNSTAKQASPWHLSASSQHLRPSVPGSRARVPSEAGTRRLPKSPRPRAPEYLPAPRAPPPPRITSAPSSLHTRCLGPAARGPQHLFPRQTRNRAPASTQGRAQAQVGPPSLGPSGRPQDSRPGAGGQHREA